MVVLGGGPIGSELAQAFAFLGVEVIQVESGDQLLNREDPDVGKIVLDSMHEAGVKVMIGTRAKECHKTDDGWSLMCESSGGGIHELPFDALLVATGRSPNGKSLPGLEEVGVQLNKRNAVQADEYLRTAVPNIYACGDIVGTYQFTHTAGHAGFYCAMNALFAPFVKLKVDWSVVPWCTFTHPEVARAGLNEIEAKASNIPHEVHTYGIDDLDRAMAEQEAEGLVKILVEPNSKGKILGVTIVGAHAGDLLHEFAVAMRNGLRLGAILKTIHVYPTMAEANKYAAGEWRKATLSPRMLAFSEWFNRYFRGG